MKLRELNEMFLSADLGPAIDWDETPSDVKNFDGKPSKLPIHIPDEFKDNKKKKKKRKSKK